MHWGIAYLREDIQELRLGQRSIQDRMDTMHNDLSGRMDSMNKDLTARMDSRFAVLLTTMIALNGITVGVVFAALQKLPAQ